MLASSFESLRTSAGSPEPTPRRPGHKRMSSLPQLGYPAATSFASLVEDNPFVFRVYTPKRKMRVRAMSDPFFMGAKYNEDEEEFFSDAENDYGSDTGGHGPVRGIAKATYMDAIRHLDWKQRRSSPYISTSFSFAWAIWEANRRYQDGVKHDVHIAVIDARALVGRATTALELLNKGPTSKRHKDHHKYQRFASEAQNVLVYGCVPSTAVLASVPLLSVMPKLPSYFARPTPEVTSDLEDIPPPKELRQSTVLTPPPSPTPFAVVFRDKPTKSSYKQFCQELSDRFLLLPESARLNDTSAHAVRLAVALLRPWLHRSLLEKETEEVEAVLCSLALLIAQWPAQWWTRDNDDVETIVRGMVQVVVQEIKETRRIHALNEVDRLQSVVDGLKRKADDLQRRQGTASESQSMSTSVTGSSVLLPPPYSGPWVAGPAPQLPKLEEDPPKTLSPVASALISGLLFGSFCMLSIIHSQRWELANHLT